MTRKATQVTDRDALKELVLSSDLVMIEPIQISLQRSETGPGDPLVVPPAVEINIRYESNSPREPQAGKATFVGNIVVTWTAGSMTYAQAQAAYRATYRFRDQKKPAPIELLTSFGSEIATHHIWPFLREKLRGLSIDAGMPPLILPLHIAGQRQQEMGQPEPKVIEPHQSERSPRE